jgi:hypothetical protein
MVVPRYQIRTTSSTKVKKANNISRCEANDIMPHSLDDTDPFVPDGNGSWRDGSWVTYSQGNVGVAERCSDHFDQDFILLLYLGYSNLINTHGIDILSQTLSAKEQRLSIRAGKPTGTYCAAFINFWVPMLDDRTRAQLYIEVLSGEVTASNRVRVASGHGERYPLPNT